MQFFICTNGDAGEEKFIPYVEDWIDGVELQSYGLSGVRSDNAWFQRVEMHNRIAPKLPGRLAIHGPFIGLDFSCPDHLLRAAMRTRMDMTYQVAKDFKPDYLILHSGYNEETIKFKLDNYWHDGVVKFWRTEIGRYQDLGTTVVLENVLEPAPDTLAAVIDGVNHPNLKVCLDIGHLNVWSKLKPSEWVKTLGHRLVYVHLHDNDGTDDSHLPVGGGNIDFDDFFEAVYNTNPELVISLEVMSEPAEVIKNLKSVISKYRKLPFQA